MTKEVRSPNDEKSEIVVISHSFICHSFELRHSDFVILFTLRLASPRGFRGGRHRNLFPARFAQC